MTQQEAIYLWQNRRTIKPDAKTLEKAKKTIIARANARITTAAKQETLGQQLAYDSSPMQLLRNQKSPYYLPSGKFDINGQNGRSSTAEVSNAVGFLSLSTTTATGASADWRRLRGAIKRNAVKYATEQAMAQMPVVAAIDYGQFGMQQFAIAAEGDLALVGSDREQKKALRAQLKQRKAYIKSEATRIKSAVDNMTSDEIRAYYRNYREYLERMYGSSESATRKKFKDYDPAANRPEAIASQLLTRGYDIKTDWAGLLVSENRRINVTAQVASRTEPSPVEQLLGTPDEFLMNPNWEDE